MLNSQMTFIHMLEMHRNTKEHVIEILQALSSGLPRLIQNNDATSLSSLKSLFKMLPTG